ncbi:glycosyltransferase [Psychromonas sp. KJ10-10]|uniref:glycosyltransferase n=1 Tax=Psychromonas sp. KJ10-10 TaxID=3391823 RepID=UPI0039B37D97
MPSSTQHLIRHLAETRKVLWINSIGLRRPTLSLRDFKRCINKLTCRSAQQMQSQPLKESLQDNLQILAPRTLPAPRNKFTRWLAVKLLLLQIRPKVKKQQLNSPLLWTSLPTAVDMAGHLNESALIYYCGDDFSGLAGVDHHTVALREQELLIKADLILASSPALIARSEAQKTQFLPHGVDYDLFTTPVPRATDLPNDGRPIAGFYGSISEWLDIQLLTDTIAQMRNWHFVFIGTAVVDISSLQAFDNVTFLGPRSHQQLPAYSQHWTASLLPFVDNAQIRACNPLKLSEYLATGRPIISTSFPAVEALPHPGLVQIANSSSAMVCALRASEHVSQLPDFTGALQSIVRDHSWKARATQVDSWLEAL